MTTREEMRLAYRRGILLSAIRRGTWPEDLPVPFDLAPDPRAGSRTAENVDLKLPGLPTRAGSATSPAT